MFLEKYVAVGFVVLHLVGCHLVGWSTTLVQTERCQQLLHWLAMKFSIKHSRSPEDES